MAINFPPISFHDSSTAREPVSGGLGEASLLAISCDSPGSTQAIATRPAAAIEVSLFIAISFPH